MSHSRCCPSLPQYSPLHWKTTRHIRQDEQQQQQQVKSALGTCWVRSKVCYTKAEGSRRKQSNLLFDTFLIWELSRRTHNVNLDVTPPLSTPNPTNLTWNLLSKTMTESESQSKARRARQLRPASLKCIVTREFSVVAVAQILLRLPSAYLVLFVRCVCVCLCVFFGNLIFTTRWDLLGDRRRC